MMQRRDIEKDANELTKVYSDVPMPVYEIAREKGLEVYVADFGDYVDTFSGFCDFKKGNIYLNKMDIEERRSFTAAHELGHWVLHKDTYLANPEKYEFMPKRRAIVNNHPDNDMEEEADFFATCLLIPRHLIRKFQPRFSARELADIFNVPWVLMEKRLKDIS